ncbi:MAG: ABC transporter permease subunit [Devosia sp.]|nr:ABC transporter permease subunit [Devosia sp.]
MALADTTQIARRRLSGGGWWVAWLIAGAAFVALWWFGSGWPVDYPKAAQVPAMRVVGDAMKWLVNEASFGIFSFVDLTRFIAALIEVPYWISSSLLATGLMTTAGSAGVQIFPPVSWIALIGVLGLAGYWAAGWRLAALVVALMAFIALFGQWTAAMVTLASIVIAVPLGVILGLLLGVLSYRAPLVERVITPLLDLMQTVPVFAYLVPVLFLFGFGPTAAIVATIIYAMPPMTRLTVHALRSVPAEIDELGRMVGATPRQRMWRVMIPAAMPGLMIGANQVIMLSLNIVIIASMIGAGGLGFEVLGALRRLDFGVGLEAGFAIVALAIVLDRLSQAVATKLQFQPHRGEDRRSLIARHPYLVASIVLALGCGLLSLVEAGFQTFPAAGQLSTGSFWAELIAWINVNFFTQLEAFKDFLLLNLLIPLKRLLLSLPWLGVVGLVALAGLQLGGWRLMLLTGGLSFLIAATGQWEKAMTTVYLCGIAVAVAALIGIPIGILAAEKRRLWPAVQAMIDTLQTLPSFVYLMPVVMLFRVGDFTAILAVVLYALAPAIRYTAHGLMQVDPTLIEAGRAAGTTRWQLLTKVKLKLAFPEIMLGLNQTIMLALSMLVITALVGTRDLGQEVYIALAKADTGRGIVAGLAIAFIAIIADRLISAGARRTKARLGLK